jgi:uncharacterized membrane protein YqjE
MLKDTLLKFFKLDGLVDSFMGFIEARVELVKIEIREDLARGIAKTLVYVCLGLLAFLFIILLSMGLAFYLGTLFKDNPHAGFFIVGGFYFLVFLLIVLARKPIEESVEKKFVDIIKLKKK